MTPEERIYYAGWLSAGVAFLEGVRANAPEEDRESLVHVHKVLHGLVARQMEKVGAALETTAGAQPADDQSS